MTFKTLTWSVCILVWLAQSGLAGAESIPIEVEGEAAVDADTARARSKAIDRAFARAIEQAVSDLTTPEARAPFRRDIQSRVVRRARRYVASFKVLQQDEREDRLHVMVRVNVNIDLVRDKLIELGVEVEASGEPPPEPPDPDDDGADDADLEPPDGDDARLRPRVALLVHAAIGPDVFTTFGQQGGDGGDAGRALARHLREQGFDIVSTAGTEVPVSRETPRGIPLSDQAAAALARASGAGGAFVIGLEAREGGRIRGTTLAGASVRATIRVLDLAGDAPSLVARASIKAGGFGESGADALSAASTAGSARLIMTIASRVTGYWPPLEAGEDGVFAVEVAGYRAWPSVAALIRHLENTRGIERVWPRRLGRSLSLAVVTELNQRRLASAIRKADLPEPARASVRKRGDRGLTVRIRGDRGTSER